MVEQTRLEEAKREVIETSEQLARNVTRVRQDIRFVLALVGTAALVLLSVPALRQRTVSLLRSLLSMTTLCEVDKGHEGGP
jgi:hypothetical protein